MQRQIFPVILSGGSGSRMWPLSRQAYPKQFLDLLGSDSLVQQTARRVNDTTKFLQPLVVANEEHRFMVADHLLRAGITPQSIILEPVAHNTAPSIALAALAAQRLGQGDAPLLILPSDHVITDTLAFLMAVESGRMLVQQGYTVTLGVTPVFAATGYGYIEMGSDIDGYGYHVSRFVEKPEEERAKGFIKSGKFLWNAGIYMVTANDYLRQLETFEPEMARRCRAAYENSTTDTAFDVHFERVNADIFASCPSNSVDYAVAERSTSMAVVPLSSGWNDIGSWDALWQESEKDDKGNATKGDVLLEQCKNNYVRTNGQLVAAVGMEDHIIVSTGDAVLVAPRARAQDVKQIYQKLQSQRRSEYMHHTKVYRPWGHYESMDVGAGFQVKRITVKPGGVLSLQLHHHRCEHWVVVSGTATVTLGEKTFDLQPDQSTYIPVETKHRLENRTDKSVELIEVQTGSYLGEDDIVRFEDVYGRTAQEVKMREELNEKEKKPFPPLSAAVTMKKSNRAVSDT